MLESNLIAVKSYLIFPCKSFCVYGMFETSVSSQNQDEHFYKYWIVQNTTQSCCWEQNHLGNSCVPHNMPSLQTDLWKKLWQHNEKKINIQVLEAEQGLRMSWGDTASTEHILVWVDMAFLLNLLKYRSSIKMSSQDSRTCNVPHKIHTARISHGGFLPVRQVNVSTWLTVCSKSLWRPLCAILGTTLYIPKDRNQHSFHSLQKCPVWVLISRAICSMAK